MNKYIETELKHYNLHFGSKYAKLYSNQQLSDRHQRVPEIVIAHYSKRDTGRPHDILITAGMSSQVQTFPEDYHQERWSTELILYLDTVTEQDIEWMVWLSSLPFIDDFALGYGHSVFWSEPLYSHSTLSKFLFISPVIKIDDTLLDDFSLAPYPVEPLWVVPITDAEYQLKREQGLAPIFTLFHQNQHPVVLNRHRRCYVSS
ncbi:Suppressor of fused protein (SUFU) [Vibrio xiamenensis]|uniref:Suppressor of fused protein (SUFU) n=1 Tax=Vibrio xiamenensis TaxID=861298 RepID=A0A1G8DXR2_9VIBR|nr:suppressor of fused domain protein [Vibrio xiamenensis]SDH62512.1 Suppressor of fused protein (SUFU) [Vibrio xiamenensis]